MPGWQMQITCDTGRLELSDRCARLIRPRSHYDWPVSDLRFINLSLHASIGRN